MKKLFIFILLAGAMFGQAANDLILTQRKPDNSGNIQRNVTASANAALGFNGSSVPVALTGITQNASTGAIGLAPGVNQIVTSTTGWGSSLTTLVYAASTNIDLSKNLQTVTLAGDITFTTSNRVAGTYTTVRVVGDGSNRTLVFPSWVFVGTTAPTTLVASKTALLTLVCFGTNDTDIVASWVSQP